MALTYSWDEAIEFLRSYGRNIPVEKVSAQICDAVSAEIWAAKPWRDACQTLPPYTLLHDTQDYDSPPTYFKLVSGQIVRTTANQEEAYDPLQVREALPVTYQIAHPGAIRAFGMERGEGLLRLSMRPNVQDYDSFELRGTYQMQHTRVQDTSQETWFKDQLWHVAQEGLLYWGYKLGDRPAAVIELQYKLFRSKIVEAWQQEDAGSDDVLYPADGTIGASSDTGY